MCLCYYKKINISIFVSLVYQGLLPSIFKISQMKVFKFGGTSVANATNIEKVSNIVLESSKNEEIVVVVSAFGGVTDLLLTAASKAASKDETYKTTFETIEARHIDVVKELIPVMNQSGILSNVKRQLNHLESLFDGCFLLGELSDRTSDAVVSNGELLSSYIISEVLKSKHDNVAYKDSRELIKTNGVFGKGLVDFDQTNDLITTHFKDNKATITLMPGFVATSPEGITTTLGRGGSDFSAAIVASALEASILEIWTDVSGMYTANPKLVKQASPIEKMSYQEAMELSHFGAKVLYPPTVQPVLNKNIPILIKNTFKPEESGTLITKEATISNNPVRGISHVDNISILTLEGSGLIGVLGSSKRLFEVLSLAGINIVFITQASSEHSVCLGVNTADADRAKAVIDSEFEFEISLSKIEYTSIESDLSILALVGDNMRNHQGLSAKMFNTLGKNNVNIRAIAQGASERNISVVMNSKDVNKAINSLHEAFFEADVKQLNLFVIGVGNVGSIFLKQIKQQKQYLIDNLKLNVRVAALANSKKMHFDENGIDLENWEDALAGGEAASIEGFVEKAKALNLRNSIFVDNTANAVVSEIYGEFLKNSIAIATCNKIASSSAYANYKELKQLSNKYNAPFLFETNVGAGLPVIDTLNNMIASGDQVTSIEAVLSGSLNFVFNEFNANTTFHDVVKQAGVEGYTEPDPKIDLSGVDVMRKILILAREAGYTMDIEEIVNDSFLPQVCLDTDNVPDFMQSLIDNEAHFQGIFKAANDKDCRLKYVATFKNGKASVGLQHIPADHPFYNLEGKDNIVVFYTDRYKDQPMLVKGAGAGAEVTASGIFADIIRIGKS